MIVCKHEDYLEAAEFYANKLGINDILIGIVSHLHMDVSGYCEYYNDAKVPFCIIGIAGPEEGQDDPLQTLAHEMVHAKQYARGELVNIGSTAACLWQGKSYYWPEVSTEEYFFSPWEVEAYGLSYGLYNLYCASLEE